MSQSDQQRPQTHHHHHSDHSALVAVTPFSVVVAADPTDGLSREERDEALHHHHHHNEEAAAEPSKQDEQQGEQHQQPQELSPRKVEGPITVTFFEAVFEVLQLVGHICANSLLSFGINRTLGMMMVGSSRLPEFAAREIAIAGIGITLYNVAGVSVPIGFACSLDYFCSTQHGRAPDSALAGRSLQTGLFMTICLLLPSTVFFLFFAEPVLSALFEASFAHDLHIFLMYCVPLMYAQSLNIVIGRGLQAQKRADLPLKASAVGTAVFLVTSILFLLPRGSSINVYPMCLTVANVVPIACTFIWCFFFDDGTEAAKKHHGNIINKPGVEWNLFNLSYWKEVCSFEQLSAFFALGWRSAAAICSEWVAIETLVLMGAVFQDDAVLAALNVSWVSIAILFCIPISSSVATSAFVGNELGANRPNHARFYAETVQIVNCFLLLFDSLLLVLFGTQWNALFTSDSRTLNFANAAMAALIIFHNAEGQHISLQGIFRGCGWQGFCAKVVALSLWCVGLPGAYLIGIYDAPAKWFGASYSCYGIGGLFLGFCLGFLFEVVLLLWGLTLLPWKELALEASQEKDEEDAELVA